MSHILTRALSAFGLGLLLLLPAAGLFNANIQYAHADELEVDDFFGEDFTDNTGLGQSDLKSTIGNLINVFLGFLGIIAVLIVLMGGFKWMTAGGNDDKVGEAKRLLVAGIIGLAIILSAYAISSFVLTSVLEASQ
ncbi:hypothetical protein HON52_00465 [Candidatus Uhrbacteria bacterium]|jgi:hypothetical protein|nr:hypothetical protein [Candidatus Uhrbacteria bacterium]